MNDDPALDERLRACSHFAHRARHELLTPLSGLSMLVSLLSGRDAELDALAKQAEAATQRMNGLLRAVLDYVDADLPLAKLGAVELEVVFREAARRLVAEEPQFARARIVRNGALPVVHGHSGWLERVARSLLDNALRYGGSASPVEVGSHADGSLWRVEVADRGPGLAQEQCSQVLQPFERLHAWDAIRGFGLSLATAQRVLRRHGGELGLRPRAGGGLVAWFTVPIPAQALRPSS